MQISLAVLLAAASLAAAQSSTSSSSPAATSRTSESGCGDQIDVTINACLDSQTAQLDACNEDDYSCLCDNSNAVLTCYNSCEDHPDALGAQQQNRQYCSAEKEYGPSTSTHATTSATPTSSSDDDSDSDVSSETTGSSHPAQTGWAGDDEDSESSSESDGAASALLPAGGLLATILGLATVL